MSYTPPISSTDWNPHPYGSNDHVRFEGDKNSFKGNDAFSKAAGEAGGLAIIGVLFLFAAGLFWFFTKTEIGRKLLRFYIKSALVIAAIYVGVIAISSALCFLFVAGSVLLGYEIPT